MTRTLSVEEEIQRPADEVWERLTDWDNASKWMPGVESMAADGETTTGTKLAFRARGGERSSAIVHCDSGTSIVLRSVQGGVTADYRYEVLDIDGRSTRVTLVADCHIEGLWLRLVSPLIRIAIRSTDGKQLKLLKAMIEGA
ncbi:MAG: SRPBCC family protein [Chloroflexi bacterium]|nr:SRPBCC family protein [Chloroflexota bacterium]